MEEVEMIIKEVAAESNTARNAKNEAVASVPDTVAGIILVTDALFLMACDCAAVYSVCLPWYFCRGGAGGGGRQI